ncbi:hypothetical protein LIER_37139 [Lithospermum erythrorhizon]|uniref:Uncharacterized protein n=1 Tax=Lithospermum erythrorhizon TaxID=34254 RepID=A0AAV3PHJ7_LITER
MSQSLENRPENFELRPRGAANQLAKTSTPTPPPPSSNLLAITIPKGAKDKVARAEKAYQDELVNIASSQAPQLVDFNDLLMDLPSLFTRVAITTKMKPRESLVPKAVASSPLASGATLPTPSINPLLKRMASDAPPAT